MEEEIGLDVSHHIRADQFIEAVYGEQKTRLYIVAGLPEDTPMLTQTRKEISDIAWVRIQASSWRRCSLYIRTISALHFHVFVSRAHWLALQLIHLSTLRPKSP